MKLLIKSIFSLMALSFLGFAHADDLEQRIRNRFIVANSFMNSPLKYGGYIMYNKEMDNNLCKIKNGKLFMVDHEGGRVNRLKSKLPAANTYPFMDNKKFYSLWTNDVKTLKNKCFDMILGPTIDVAFADRSYSDDLSYNLTIADKISNIVQSQKMIPAYKHFPGELIGCREVYARKEIRKCPQGMQEIQEIWKPFKNSQAPALIISNYIYEKYSMVPAVLDKNYYSFLRNELNYQGVILTDALWEMSIPLTTNTVWEMFKNADLLMIMNPLEAEKFVPILVDKIKNDPQEITNLEEKEKRILKMKGLL